MNYQSIKFSEKLINFQIYGNQE